MPFHEREREVERGEGDVSPSALSPNFPTSLTFSPLRFLSFHRPGSSPPGRRVLSHPLNPSAHPCLCSEVTGFLVRKEANRHGVSPRTNCRRHSNGHLAMPGAGAFETYDSTCCSTDVHTFLPMCRASAHPRVFRPALTVPVTIYRRSMGCTLSAILADSSASNFRAY